MKSPDAAFRINWIKKFIASSFNSTVSLTIVKRPLLIMVLIFLLNSFLILSEVAISRLFCIICPVATVVSSIPSPLMVSYCKKALFFHRQCFNMAPVFQTLLEVYPLYHQSLKKLKLSQAFHDHCINSKRSVGSMPTVHPLIDRYICLSLPLFYCIPS